MAFFTNKHKKLAVKTSREALQQSYAKSEEKLRQISKSGNEKALKQAMKEHGNIEYAMLYQSTPEFKEKRKKYLQKNEFRYDTNPLIRKKNGEGHNAYVSAKQGHRAQINILTHSDTFFGEPTFELDQNPERSKPSKRKSRFSKAVWENDKHLKEPSRGTWVLSKKDKAKIKKVNKKYPPMKIK